MECGRLSISERVFKTTINNIVVSFSELLQIHTLRRGFLPAGIGALHPFESSACGRYKKPQWSGSIPVDRSCDPHGA